MPRVLVLFGTSDGHTATIATAISQSLIDLGIATDVIQAGSIDPGVLAYDGVIVAASIRAGAFPKPLVACVTRHAREIASRPNAFLPVCLAINQKDDPKVTAHLSAIVDRFSMRTGWTPMTTKFIPGALLYTRYNFLVRWMMKRIVARAGGDTDTSRDYVYTDWTDVKKFARDFGSRLKAAAA